MSNMGLFDGFFKRFSPPEQKSVNAGLFSYIAPNAVPFMTEKQYLEAYKGWVFACTDAIATRMASIELKLQQKQEGDWIDEDEHPALDLIHKVNKFMSFYDLWYATQAFIELDGNAFWLLRWAKNGKDIFDMWILDPTCVQIAKSKDDFIAGYVYTPPGGEKIPLGIDEIIHFKNFHPRNPFRGMGTVEAAAVPIDIHRYAGEFQRNFFGNSATPSGILSTDGTLSDDQYNRIKANWDAKYTGLSNAHKMALLEGGMKWQSLTPAAREMQFTESKKDVRDEILGIFRTPKPILGILEDVNLASAEVAEIVYAKNVVRPKMMKNIITLNEFYLPLINLDTRKFRFWFKDPVPEDTNQKLSIIGNGRTNNWLTRNEARAMFGYEPVEGGDELDEPTLVTPIPDSDKPDDPAHAEQDHEEEENQEDKEKDTLAHIAKLLTDKPEKVKKKESPKNNDYLQEQIGEAKTIYLDLNKKLEDVVLGELKEKSISARRYLKDGEPQNDLVRIIFESDEFKDWVGLLFNATKDKVQELYEQAGKDAIAETAVDVSFDLENPRAMDWINDHALETTDSYSGTWKENISLAVQEGIEQGSSVDDIKNNIKQYFIDQSDWRAERIARSETISAYNNGNLQGYIQSGVVSGVEWLPDAEACPICQENAAAGVIPLGDDFPSGDPCPIAHPNCECSLQPVVDSGDDSSD